MDTEKDAAGIGGNEIDYEAMLAAENTMPDARQELKPERGVRGEKKVSAGEKAEKYEGGVYEWVQCLVAALLICVIIFSFFFRIIGIKGSSMVPTFHNGDSVIISNILYTPSNGDVVVLRKDTFQEEPIIKRVIAVAGQTVNIDFEQGIVYVDDEPIDEPYIAEPTHNRMDFEGEVLVPEGSVFVMGDNRNASTDSRYSVIGCVDNRYIMGKVLLRIFPFNQFGTVN